MSTILGFSTTHDSGATLLRDGELVAAVNEERFNRIKHFGYLPYESIRYCLEAGDLAVEDLDAVAVPSEALHSDADLLFDGDVDPTNISADPTSLTDKVIQTAREQPSSLPAGALRKATSALDGDGGPVVPEYAKLVEFPASTAVYLVNHHESHAATAYYYCGHDDALVVTLDGLGDSLSGTVWHGRDGDLEPLREWGRNGSLGWFFGIVTQALGWWIGNGEGKTMGLAAYTDPDPDAMADLREVLPEYEDGELVDEVAFSDVQSWRVKDTLHWSFEEAEYVETLIEEYDRETVAASAQRLLEEQIVEIVDPWLERTGADHLATAGGVFLNVKVNRRILADASAEDYFIFPNAGDGGLPTGAVLATQRHLDPGFGPTRLDHPYYGPDIESGVEEVLEGRQLTYERPDDITATVARLLADGNIVAWCQGRMEYGPRALGNRSILIDPTREDSKARINDRVKFRDSWRPFAPSILEEAADEYFENPTYDPFMITSVDVRPEKRDEIPAVTHVDDTSRPQMVRESVNPEYYRLIEQFAEHTGTPVVLNTSYNLSGDPIVAGARDAITTFFDCGIDALALGEYLLRK